MARVKFEPTEEQRENVELLAAVGTKHDLIARMITDPATGRHISDKTLRKYFRDELDLGLAKANAIVGQTLFQMASSGLDTGATCFWMKTRAGWKEVAVTQNQALGADGEPINPPSFGVSFSNGAPGNQIGDKTGIDISGEGEESADSETESVEGSS